MKRLLIGHRISGPLGVVTDTRFVRCYWPKLDQPTRLFAEGSKGIEVLGSARNVWFPDDTKWLDYYPDALYPAELAVLKAFRMRALINLTDEQAAIWQAAYDAAVATFPKTHAIHSSPRHCLFVRRRQLINAAAAKPIYEEQVCEVTPQQAMDIVAGKPVPVGLAFRGIDKERG